MRRQVDVAGSALLALAGGAAWLVGTSALPGGQGTVVLAVGLAVTVWLVIRASRAEAGHRPRLDGRNRRRAVYLVAVGVGLVVLAAMLLRGSGRGELVVPLAAAVCGALFVPLASLLDRRSLLAVGGALMLLGAGAAVLALNSAGRTESQGLVGFVGGVLLWTAAAYDAGVLGELRHRIRR